MIDSPLWRLLHKKGRCERVMILLVLDILMLILLSEQDHIL